MDEGSKNEQQRVGEVSERELGAVDLNGWTRCQQRQQQQLALELVQAMLTHASAIPDPAATDPTDQSSSKCRLCYEAACGRCSSSLSPSPPVRPKRCQYHNRQL